MRRTTHGSNGLLSRVPLLALWSEGDVINGNVASFFRSHSCLNCQGKGCCRVGESNVGLFPDILVDPVHWFSLPQFVLLTLGQFPDCQLTIAHSMHVVEYPQMASHLVMEVMIMVLYMMMMTNVMMTSPPSPLLYLGSVFLLSCMPGKQNKYYSWSSHIIVIMSFFTKNHPNVFIITTTLPHVH